MYFYRRPMWGIGFKILMIFLIIAGGTFIARSAFQAGLAQGVGLETGEITGPMLYPHAKGWKYPHIGGSFLPVLAIFLGGILLVKLITSIVGLVMFKRWKDKGGPEWDEWKAHKYHGHHFGPCQPGPWGFYPYSPMKKGADESEKDTQPDQNQEN